jgi:cell division septation protein DedD
MNYVERYTEAQAIELVVELKGEGYNAYFTKNNADSFTVQYWR